MNRRRVIWEDETERKESRRRKVGKDKKIDKQKVR